MTYKVLDREVFQTGNVLRSIWFQAQAPNESASPVNGNTFPLTATHEWEGNLWRSDLVKQELETTQIYPGELRFSPSCDHIPEMG